MNQNIATQLAEEVKKGNRLALAKAITLIESRKADDIPYQHRLMELIMAATGQSIRIAITGPPGVGKSTTIEALGLAYIQSGHKVAVLAVDPSSERTKGSILGDKTRMVQLSREENAFIRPSASNLELGGVKQSTRASMLLCEAAGFDVIIVETVGAGQNEFYAHAITDLLILLLPTQAGDEVQGIKRGIMEMANIYLINKADGQNEPKAQLLKKELETILPYLSTEHQNETPTVLTFSALHKTGVDKLISTIAQKIESRKTSGAFDLQRTEQAKRWLEDMLIYRLLEKIRSEDSAAKALLNSYMAQINPMVYPGAWVDEILNALN
jgi:LAO/AO transport system kinase